MKIDGWCIFMKKHSDTCDLALAVRFAKCSSPVSVSKARSE